MEVAGGSGNGIAVRRVIGRALGDREGPVLICVAGLHGNEPAGVRALQRIVERMEREDLPLRGEFVGLSGNLRALAQGKRYLEQDLNRIWSAAAMKGSPPMPGKTAPSSEECERQELLAELESIFQRVARPVTLVDLHTSSADGQPFACVGDTLRNRAFAFHFPVPIILGLEEHLDGTLLEYVNNLGHTTMGFEGGRHDSPGSVDTHEAAIWVALVAAGLLREDDVPELHAFRQHLSRDAGRLPRILEVRYRHPVTLDDQFKMEPGFGNFNTVAGGQLLARDRRGDVRAPEDGRILLPLYQGLGDDGFFVTREVRPMWLKLSAVLRHLRIGWYIHWLPGVQRQNGTPDTLVVDPKIARLWPVEMFHLLGYRKRRWVEDRLIVSRRLHDDPERA